MFGKALIDWLWCFAHFEQRGAGANTALGVAGALFAALIPATPTPASPLRTGRAAS